MTADEAMDYAERIAREHNVEMAPADVRRALVSMLEAHPEVIPSFVAEAERRFATPNT